MKFLAIVCVLLLCGGCISPKKSHRSPATQVEESIESIKEETKEPVLLGTWKTEIHNRDAARVHNITLAVYALQGYTMLPEEQFSFNALLGERTEEKGYQKADVFVGDTTEKAYGGGICQVSGTLYMAVKQAGLSVTERHAHSKPVTYAGEGEDACVNYGTMDFCFVNTCAKTIEIHAMTDGASVTVEIWEQK